MSFILQFCSFSRSFLSRCGSITSHLWPVTCDLWLVTSPGRTAFCPELHCPLYRALLWLLILLQCGSYMSILQQDGVLLMGRSPIFSTSVSPMPCSWHRICTQETRTELDDLMVIGHFGPQNVTSALIGLKTCGTHFRRETPPHQASYWQE